MTPLSVESYISKTSQGNALDAAPCSLEYPRGLAALFKAEPVLSAEEYAICGLRGVKAVLEHNSRNVLSLSLDVF